jgi:eukaryotic-like serine/threonine-protein kinase
VVIVAALIGVVVIATGAALLRSRERMGPANERVWNPIGLVPAALAPETTDFHAAPVQPEPPLPVRSPSPDGRGGQGVRTPVARRAQVVKAPGYLSINSRPWAEVSVDGQVVGNTPQIKIRVTPGRHHLVLAREGFQTHSAWVVVPAGGSVRLTDITLRVVTR